VKKGDRVQGGGVGEDVQGMMCRGEEREGRGSGGERKWEERKGSGADGRESGRESKTPIETYLLTLCCVCCVVLSCVGVYFRMARALRDFVCHCIATEGNVMGYTRADASDAGSKSNLQRVQPWSRTLRRGREKTCMDYRWPADR
jgi:hypothetical protein